MKLNQPASNEDLLLDALRVSINGRIFACITNVECITHAAHESYQPEIIQYWNEQQSHARRALALVTSPDFRAFLSPVAKDY